MSPRLALIALLTLPLAACEGTGIPGLGSQQDAQVEGHKGPPSVSPLEQPIETGEAPGKAVATAEGTTNSTGAFSARGNEPFWAVDVAGGTAIYKTPGNQKGRAIRVNRLTFDKGVEYVGVLSGRPFVLNIRGAACQDTMSDEKFPFTATLTVSGRSNSGCASPASAEVANAVAATKAPAPAAPRRSQPAAAPKPAPTRPATAPAAAAAVTETETAAEASSTDSSTETEAPTTPQPAAETATTPAAPATPAVPAPAIALPSTPPAVTPAVPADVEATTEDE
ncbi:hypothetical protein PAF17_00980 [Paracoccus sp. Z330]|uniref:Uncharacterized protein n=1 Tax=Paracoccus onchidii TaxID=3017813 RepID=A0ABT4ZAW0_9RHOB|nr:hypothetical protein [Paracoccus onchidii]MDB6176078.1 hypothetical protein [Paracoccus onchidii]